MSRQPKNNNNISQKTIRRWHRWVGYTSLFFVMILSITGLTLNRSERLGLNQIMVQGDFVSSLYGLSPNSPPIHYQTNDHWISWLEGRVYLDGKFFALNSSRPTGATIVGDILIIGTKDGLSLYMKDGSLVETVPGEITAIDQPSPEYILIKTPNGIYKPDADFISWQETSEIFNPSPNLAIKAPQHIAEKINKDYQGEGVTLSRLILDLHSGNIMGSYGSYIMDLAALSLIFLGATGFMKRRRSDKDRRKKK